MHFSDDQLRAEAREDPNHIGMGVVMLIVFFVFDSLTSQWQDSVCKKHPEMSHTQMMLGGNILGLIFTLCTLFSMWSKVTESLVRASENPMIKWRIVALGFVASLGQFSIYSGIKILGSVAFSWIWTARQLLSVLISLMILGQGLTAIKLFCILVI